MSTWIVDVDGTLARRGDRDPYDLDRVGEDRPNEPVLELIQALLDQVGERRIFVVSGRQDCCQDATEEWLARHGVRYRALIMRATDDPRKDAVVKKEMFLNKIMPMVLADAVDRMEVAAVLPPTFPLGEFRVLDDRDQCVSMWRSLGLFCAQVAPGDF